VTKWWYIITPLCVPMDGSRVLYRRKGRTFAGYEITVVPDGEGGQGFPAWSGAIGFIPKEEWEDQK